MAVVLATVLTVNPFSPAGVGAHVPDANQDDECDVSHEDFQGTPCTESGHDEPHENIIEVDGGRDRELVFRVYPPSTGSYLDENEQIRITLPEFDLSETKFSSNDDAMLDLIDVDDSGDFEAVHPDAAVPDGQTLTLPFAGDLAGIADGEGDYLVITIKEGTGILTPELRRRDRRL